MYKFVAAKYYTVGGMVSPRAVVVHMAEGGGTVSWLTHPSNNNSAHFVVEYSGRVVQMVKDTDASHSLHVARSYGPPGVGDYGYFSLNVAAKLLGSGIGNPNAYIFAVEVEGFAKYGPNPKQIVALRNLVADLRGRHPTIKGMLGHRDFQDYKPCPGPFIYDKFQHGPFTPGLPDTGTGEEIMEDFPAPATPMQAVLKTGVWLYDNSTLASSSGNTRLSPNRPLLYLGQFSPSVRMVTLDTTRRGMFVREQDVERYEPIATTIVSDPADKAEIAKLTSALAVEKQKNTNYVDYVEAARLIGL